MNGYTHKIGGTSAGLLATSLASNIPYSPEKFIVAGTIMAGSIIGSLLPDIDHKNSTISKKHKILSWFIRLVCDHRGITHAPLVQAVLIMSLLYLGRDASNIVGYAYIGFVVGLGIGIFNHLFLDLLTVSGIPLLYPFTKKKIHLMTLNTTKHSRATTVFIICLTVVIIGIKLFFALNNIY